VRRTRAAAQQLPGTGAGPQRPTSPTTNLPATAIGTGPASVSFVWAFRAMPDSVPNLAQTDPDYLTQVGADGTFHLDGLPLGVPLRVFAIFDSDRSRTFSPDRDYATTLPEPVTLSEAAPTITNMTIFLIDPKAAGSVSGRLAARADTSQVDTLSYGVLLSSYPEEPDTTEAAWPPPRAAKQGMVTKTGTFTIRSVSPGRYRAGAFVDLDKNGSWSRSENLGPPVEVRVRPDEETGNVEVPRPPSPG
jgi:hypothetical protein